jgi:hypothetical protein
VSTLLYSAITSARKAAPPAPGDATGGGQTQSLGKYVDSLAALVPAEVLAAHAAILGFTTTASPGRWWQDGHCDHGSWGLARVLLGVGRVGGSPLWFWPMGQMEAHRFRADLHPSVGLRRLDDAAAKHSLRRHRSGLEYGRARGDRDYRRDRSCRSGDIGCLQAESRLRGDLPVMIQGCSHGRPRRHRQANHRSPEDRGSKQVCLSVAIWARRLWPRTRVVSRRHLRVIT